MKKIWNVVFVLMAGLFLMGCSDKFEPTESTIYITSKGEVKSALMEDFEKAYYDFEELSEAVAEEVRAYNLDVNAEVVTLESLTEGAGEVTLLMNYQTVEDYIAFNEVLLFNGTYAEAVAAGYNPAELYDTEGMLADLDSANLDNLKVLVTEESTCIQTSGRIKYVSDNVAVIDKKLARAVEAGKSYPAFVLYK